MTTSRPTFQLSTIDAPSPLVDAPEAADAQRADALLEAVHAMCKLHGVAATRESLAAGQPLDGQGMSIRVAARAAARAGLETRLYRVKLAAMEQAALPAVLMLRGRGACVLTGFDEHGHAKVLLAHTGMATVTMPRDALEKRYAGVAMFARPKFRYDARTSDARAPRGGHWFWSAVLAQRAVYRDVLWAAALVNLFAIALPMFTMNVYDRVVPNAAFETLWALAIGVTLVLCGDLAMRLLRSRFVDEAAARIDTELSARLMQKVLGLKLEHRPASVGAFAATLRGFEQVRDFVASSTVTALIDLPFGLLFLVIVTWISPWLALPVIGAFAITIVSGALLQHRLHQLAHDTQRATAQRNATLVESLAGLETLKAQGAEGRVQAIWERANEHLSGLNVRMRALSNTALSLAAWIAQFAAIVIVVVGVYLISDRLLTMGALIAVSMLASRALAPAGQIVGLLMQMQGARTALASLDRLMESPVERPTDGDDRDTAPFVARGALQGAIEFRNVSFAYPGREDPVLADVSFTIAAGEHVAFLGKAGSGKSTIQRLVLGLYRPTAGTILVDGIDIRQLDPAELRRQIASVGQEALLFYGTLRENISLGLPHAEDAEVLAVARHAGLAAFIDRHPLGLNLPVGERGELLSGGQRQAVALARALLRGGSMVCLDEPSSAMDNASELQIARHLQATTQGKTLLLATHRRTLLPLTTRLIVIDAGRVVADGPRDQVLGALDASSLQKAS